MIKLGWKAGAEQYPPGELLEYAVAADQAGFDLLDVSDHFHPWSEAGQASFAWTWLGAAAARTSRIVLGTGLTAPILRYHPAIVAQAAATLACLAPGRTTPTIATAFPLYGLPLLVVAPLYLFVFKEMIGKELVDAVGDSASQAGAAISSTSGESTVNQGV